MDNQSNIQGDHNVVIQGVTDSSITLNINGKTQEILNRLDALQALLEQLQISAFQTADNTYRIGTINESNFGFLLDRMALGKKLPEELSENLIKDEQLWTKSLRQELLKKGVAVGNNPLDIFQHYGWLIEIFLQKIKSNSAKKHPLKRLSFMVQAYQSSLRYLCYIQLSQILQMEELTKNPVLVDFFQLDVEQYPHFDILNLLQATTEILSDKEAFIPEITDLLDELFDPEEDLYSTVLFLESYIGALKNNRISEDEKLPQLLDEYLTALVFWMRKIAFLANYRLVSIKDINLIYRLGFAQNFEHVYGELHGMYESINSDNNEEFRSVIVKDFFTFNQSVLLFKGNHIESCLRNISDTNSYLSLSPLIIDQSVYVDKETQTPEVYYYTGKRKRQFEFARYRNEMALGEQTKSKSNKLISIKKQNNQQPGYDELYEQLDHVLKPFKASVK